MKSAFIMPHVDAVINLSNWIGGYRNDRLYYANLFLGAGFGVTDIEKGDGNCGVGLTGVVGLINTFRVSKAIDINIELEAAALGTADMPSKLPTDDSHFNQIYSATVGVTYRFNKRDWEKAYSQTEVNGYLASIAALEAGLADAHRNEGKLAERLAAQKAALDKTLKELEDCQKSKKPATVSAATALFFNFDSYRLLDRAKASMKLVAEAIAASPEEQVFTIVGHADVKTGSAAYNQKLSEKRAKAVYDYLVEQGVAKEKLTWKGVGSSQNIFPVNNTNRVVIIK
jgi:outer membrane protein OmpA-like peptidoglycan-associated protein